MKILPVLNKAILNVAISLVFLVPLLVSAYKSHVAIILIILTFIFLAISNYKSDKNTRIYYTAILIVCIYASVHFCVKMLVSNNLHVVAREITYIVWDTNSSEIRTLLSNIPAISYAYIVAAIYFALIIQKRENKNRPAVKNSWITKILFAAILLNPYFVFFKTTVGLALGAHDIYLENVESPPNRVFTWNAIQPEEIREKRQTYIIVIGETTRGDKMSINGFEMPTTPLLQQHEVVSFANAASNASWTLGSTPIIFKRYDPQTLNAKKGESSFISAFKEAGFETHYVSYLSKVHAGDNEINKIVNEADYYHVRPGDYDDGNISVVSEILKRPAKKKLIVVKLIGSHFNFHDRYPKNFDIFKPSFSSDTYKIPTPEDRIILNNTYANSILFTDFIVSKFIDILKEQEGISYLSFISDHGTALLEDGRTYLNGRLRPNFKIPIFFWFSDEYLKLEPGRKFYKRLEKNKGKPVDSTFFLDTTLDLSFILTETRSGQSLVDKELKIKKRLVKLPGNFILDFDADLE